MTGIQNMLLGGGGLTASSLSLTAATSGNNTGYESGVFGSLSPSTVGGKTIGSLYDTSLGTTITFALTGLSANPGQAWLGSIVSNSHTFNGSAASYGYSSGTATWTWSSSSFGWSAGTYPVTINHY